MNGRGGPRRAGWAAVMAAVAVLSVGCGGGGDDEATPPPTIAEPTTPTTTDPYAVPAVIDAAYVNRVLEKLDATTSEVVRIVVRSRALPPEAVERLESIYDDPDLLQLRLDAYSYLISTGLEGFRPDPGNQKTTVTQLLVAAPTCIFARVSRDYSQVVMTRNEPSTEWIALKPKSAVNKGYNPTSWALTVDGTEPDGSAPADPCMKGT